jgi:phosphocarrier protein HPr
MLRISLALENKLGLHARASAKFVATASKFISKIDITKGSQNINGKSIMGVMMLGAKCGTILDCVIEGPDETEMGEALIKLVKNKFDEAE